MNDQLLSLILRRLAVTKNDSVAMAIGHDSSHISRIASGERGIRIGELGEFLTAIGLTVIEVGGSAVTIPAEKYRALQVLARDALRFDEEPK